MSHRYLSKRIDPTAAAERESLTTMQSPEGSWGAWEDVESGGCSVSCGDGIVVTRKRVCGAASGGGAQTCTVGEEMEDAVKCNEARCYLGTYCLLNIFLFLLSFAQTKIESTL